MPNPTILDKDGERLALNSHVQRSPADGRAYEVEEIASDGVLIRELHTRHPVRKVAMFRKGLLRRARVLRCPDLVLLKDKGMEDRRGYSLVRFDSASEAGRYRMALEAILTTPAGYQDSNTMHRIARRALDGGANA